MRPLPSSAVSLVWSAVLEEERLLAIVADVVAADGKPKENKAAQSITWVNKEGYTSSRHLYSYQSYRPDLDLYSDEWLWKNDKSVLTMSNDPHYHSEATRLIVHEALQQICLNPEHPYKDVIAHLKCKFETVKEYFTSLIGKGAKGIGSSKVVKGHQLKFLYSPCRGTVLYLVRLFRSQLQGNTVHAYSITLIFHSSIYIAS